MQKYYIRKAQLNTMTIKKTLFAVSLIPLLVAQCTKHNEDPCKDQVPFKTDFGIYIKDKYSKAKDGDTLIEIKDGDTCLADYIKFISKSNIAYTDIYDSVKWEIGNAQNTSKLRDYQLLFGLVEYNISISLTGYKKKLNNYNCFPNDPTVQTITKIISVVGPTNSLPIVGNFFGYNEDNPTDTFTISTRFEPARNYFVMKNFPKGNKGFPYGVLPPPIDSFVGIHPTFYGYDYFFIDNNEGSVAIATHGGVTGAAKITNRNSIIINYEQYVAKDAQGYWINLKKRKFIGTRI